MTILLCLWLIGWMFSLGFADTQDIKDIPSLEVTVWILLLFTWPYWVGIRLNALLEGR